MKDIQIEFNDGKIEMIDNVINTHYRNKYLIITTFTTIKDDNNQNVSFRTENIYKLSKIKNYTYKIKN
jgi:hypothetical protein